MTSSPRHAYWRSSPTSTISLMSGSGLDSPHAHESTALRDWSDTPYDSIGGVRGSGSSALLNNLYLPPDPRDWGSNVSRANVEPDDDLHDPEFNEKRTLRNTISSRGAFNVACLVILVLALLTLFVGYPIASQLSKNNLSKMGGFNLGGINSTGQVPDVGNFGLIDHETPKEAYTKKSWMDGSEMQLVFSDEFNTDGRSFYPGDDPYWEAVDLHYWATGDLEWYDPSAVTTKGGALKITLSQKENHDLDYQGGMISSWNKFCFTGGYLEASVTLPGANNVAGLWPAVWAMGNLGRAGYGASTDGLWPYTYDACDVGTLKNQTLNGAPLAATNSGPTDDPYDGALSFLGGQRLSRCTCAGESHPGPKHSDGTFVGRSAPEIDVFEAQMSKDAAGNVVGAVSQSAQWAPFNKAYDWDNSSTNLNINDATLSTFNTYVGGPLQQATSVITQTDQNCYELGTGCFSTYGFEYLPGFDNGYITWISNNAQAWTIHSAGLGADNDVQISARPIPQEPMYVIMNLGMSTQFGKVDTAHLTFPATMSVDYVRVYQPSNSINVGCSPKGFPTEDYIKQFPEAYNNANLTTWKDDFKQAVPKNSLVDSC